MTLDHCPCCRQAMAPPDRTRFRGVSLEARFAASYAVHEATGCWIWTGGRAGEYGQIYAAGANQRAHRVSYLLHVGDVPAELVVCHRCDTPLCVNPDHLFLGTQFENIADMDRKGRRGGVRGERVNSAKLTEADVRGMRELFGELPHAAIAERYGVSTSLVSQIRRGNCWAHLSDPSPAPLFDGGR